MIDIEKLLNKVQRHVRDVNVTRSELLAITNDTLDDITTRIPIFKKLFGFSVHKDKRTYDFRALARMNEQVEMEPVSITYGDPNIADIIDFISNGDFPDIVVDKTEYTEDARSRYVDLIDIYAPDGRSVMDFFHYRGGDQYFVYNDDFLAQYDGEQFAYLAWVSPELTELTDDALLIVMPALIPGVKFHVYDMLHSSVDVQSTNYDFMRYHQAIEELQNRFPTRVYGAETYQKDVSWL
jgi:hypothetical protein